MAFSPSPRTTTPRACVAGLAAALAVALAACGRGSDLKDGRAAAASYVGRAACRECHAAADGAWTGSHHDLAMQVADATTVLGDFGGSTFRYAGVTSTFFRRGSEFIVRTDGPDGKLADFAIRYTFGVTPLQQYLIEMEGGRLQALGIAWDTRERAAGGQRWFHLYPDERIVAGDELHWTGLQQNWNFMCAECHSTHLKKNYDAATHTFRTGWSEIDVSCEACHGPGSQHVEFARRAGSGGNPDDARRGLTVSFAARTDTTWVMDPVTRSARPRPGEVRDAEEDVCAPCHSRRSSLDDTFAAGDRFLDHYLPSLPIPPLYYADGQQREEVYIWGSFLQSRMHFAGVTCRDCHDPHSLRLRAPGNVVCARCHSGEKYDVAAHHFHAPGTPGAGCVDCHMPETTYMVIDPRRDHSLRVPRPDLSVSLGVPNACSRCHRDRTARWAADQVERWYGHAPSGFQRYTFDPSARGDGEETRHLASLLRNASAPEITRAAATAMLGNAVGPERADAIEAALADTSALVRRTAVAALSSFPAEHRLLAAGLLDDPVRIVRIEAASTLAPLAGSLPADRSVPFARAAGEYEAAQRFHADRPEYRVNLGSFFAERGRYVEAEAELRAATSLERRYVPAWVNLADAMRVQGRDADAEDVLREGLTFVPDDAALHHSLGLTLVRRGRDRDAIGELGRAARLAPDDARFAYVYAVALNSGGRGREAIHMLERSYARNPHDRDVLAALATFHRDAGDIDMALVYADRLAALNPDDPGARALLQELRAAR